MTDIEWTDLTWNPFIGCSRVSEGCRDCYAERLVAMVARTTHGRTPHAAVIRQVSGRPRFNGTVAQNTDSKFYQLRRLHPRAPPLKIFVNSLSDAFHPEAIANGLTAAMFYEMRMAPGHIYQVLTKRPESAACFYADHPEVQNLPGVWLGVSVEDAKAMHRVDILRGIPSQVRFLSVEPLIAPLGALDLSGIHWVIVGGESGRKSRPMRPEWVREVRDQCIAAGVPLFFKQWGGPAGAKRGHEEAVLDGREWKEFPA
jgi:protein gp37